VRIRLAIPDHLVTPPLLEAALEATSLANQAAIEQGEAPLLTEAISKGIKWQEEPFVDGEHFDLLDEVMRRGWGDCDDLAPALTAQLRATGDDPDAVTRILRTGPKRWHAVTETGDGRILDPSRWAGMGRRSKKDSHGVHGTIAPPLAHPGGGALYCLPHKNGWRARCDIPFDQAHLASHAWSRIPEHALARAVEGALYVGGYADPDMLDRCAGAAEFLLSGVDDVVLRDAHNISKTGWTFGEKRITTADANALQMYAAKGNTWLSRYGDHGKPDVAAQQRIDQNRDRIINDIYFAAQILDTLSKHERTWIRDKYHPHGFLHDVKSIAKGPLGWALNPAMALAYHTSKDKKFAGARDIAMKAAMPGMAAALPPGLSPSMLSTLTQGAKGILQPAEGGTIERDPRSGAVSVPLESPDVNRDQHMFLFYHPLGNPGPVVMRF